MRFNSQMMSIARDYIELHKDTDLVAWQPFGKTEEEKLMLVYFDLTSDVYGKCRDNGMDEMVVEIPGHQRKDGNSYLFTFAPVFNDGG